MPTATINEASAAQETQDKKPVKTFRHRAISASVFENASKHGERNFYSVSIQRAYKVGEEFRHSSSFTRDEIPVVGHLLKQAWAYILDAESKRPVEADQ